MSIVNDCYNEAFEGFGKTIAEIFSNPDDAAKFKEIMEEAEGLLNARETATAESMFQTFDEALQATGIAVERMAKQALFNEADAAIKLERMRLEVLTTSPDANTALRNLRNIVNGSGGSSMHVKEAREREFHNAFLSYIKKAPKDIARNAEKLYESFGSRFVQTDALKQSYQKFMKAVHVLDYNKGEIDAIKELYANPEEAAAVHHLYKAIKHTNDKIYQVKTDLGLYTNYDEKYLWRREYSKQEIMNMEKNEFVDLFTENVSDEMYLPSIKDDMNAKRKVFEDMYDRIIRSASSSIDIDEAMGATLLSRTKSRKILFRDGEGAYNVFQRLAPTTDLTSIQFREYGDAASSIATFSTFGARPKEIVGELLADIRQKSAKGGFGDKVKNTTKIQETQVDINQFLDLMAERPDSHYGTLGKVLYGLRTMQLMKLGSTAVTTAPYDILSATFTSMTDRGTANAFSTMFENAKRFFSISKDFSDPAKRQQMSEVLGLNSNIIDGTLASRMEADRLAAEQSGAVLEKMNLAAAKMAKYSGLNLQTILSSGTSAFESSHSLSQLVRSFKNNEMTPAFAEMMQQARLTQKEMSLLAENFDVLKGTDGLLSNDDMFLNPMKIYALDPKVFSASEAAGRRQQQQLINKVRGFMNGRQKQGTPQPTLRTSTKLGKKTFKTSDAIFDSMFTFKSTIMEMGLNYKEQFERMVRTQGFTGAAAASSSYFGMSIGAYMAIDTFQAALLDKEPAYKKMMRGDAESVYLDFATKTAPAPMVFDPVIRMVENRNRWGQSAILDSLQGPVGSMIRDAENIMKSSDKVKASGKFFRSHMVPSSLWWMRGGLRHADDFDILKGKKQDFKDKGFLD